MRWWLGSLVVVPLVAAVACGDDDAASGPGSGTDGGAESATPYAPPEPVLPLQCAAAGTFDPCDAGLDPSVYGATQPDGGAIANVDAGGYADAGSVASACVTTGAARITCADDAGAARFDLAAGAGGISHVVAFGPRASRFELDPIGTMTTPTAFDARDDELRIVSSAAGVAVIRTRPKSTDVTAIREATTTRDFATLGGRTEDPAIAGVGMTDDGTIYGLFHAPAENFWRQPARVPEDSRDTSELSPVSASVLFVGSSGFQLVGQQLGGFAVFPPSDSHGSTVVEAPGVGAIFAAGLGPKGALVAAYDNAAHDRAQLAVFIGHDFHAPSFTRVRIQREPRCQQTGCGYTCQETRRTPLGGGGSFVHLANGNDYFVYGEATVTNERAYAIDHDAACDLLGGCACASKAELRSVGDVDAVVMQVTTDPDRLIERARAHIALTDPKRTLLDGKPGNGLRATAHENQIHVLLQGSASEMARVVIDLGH